MIGTPLKLAKDLPGRLALVWVHVRRDFMDIGVGRPDMKPFGDKWPVKIRDLYSAERYWIPGASEQTAAFDKRELELRIRIFFDDVRQQLGDLPEDAPQRKPSLLRHREGLEVFVPAVPTILPNALCAVPRSGANCHSARSARRERN